MYRGYKTDERFGNYEENLSKGRIFPRSYEDKSIEELLNLYKENLIRSLGNVRKDVQLMSAEINQKDKYNFYDIIISVPSFYKEENIQNTIHEIQKQAKQNPEKHILLLIYNNGYQNSQDTLTEINNVGKSILKTLDSTPIKNLVSVVISKEYQEKPSISKIRSDMFDVLMSSNASKKIDDKTIYLSFDADIRGIENGYVEELIKYHNMGYKIVIGDRNRTFEEEKKADLFLFLQEKLFLLGEELIYNKSEDKDIDTLTNGWSSSFNLKSLLLVKGYERNFNAADDLIVGHKLNRFYGDTQKNKDIAYFMKKRIWSDPSRGSDILQQGKLLFEQREPSIYDVKEERITKKGFYEKENSIITLLLKGGTLNKDDISWLEGIFKSYIEYFSGKNIYLNNEFRTRLVFLLKDFFGDICAYDFIYALEEDKIFLNPL